jgi:hypothetical protein
MLMETLRFALERMRPYGGRGEEELARYIEDAFPDRTFRDTCGNVHLDLRMDTGNRTLFVAHLDTVHRTDGKNKIRRTPTMWFGHKAPLGADDGAGVAMLCHLASNSVPGYYVFTRGEERGGIGAEFLADRMPDLLRQFDRAIAFDRKGVDSVITHQGFGGRCCSDEFGSALALALSTEKVWYLPDDTGVYTDTAEFVDLVPECTNISVGYDFEHSSREQLDLVHFAALANIVLTVAWDELPTHRDPTPAPRQRRKTRKPPTLSSSTTTSTTRSNAPNADTRCR